MQVLWRKFIRPPTLFNQDPEFETSVHQSKTGAAKAALEQKQKEYAPAGTGAPL
jgi:hypothetical protein